MAGLAMGVLFLVSNILQFKVDLRELPVVHGEVPLFGHIIGILREGLLHLGRKD